MTKASRTFALLVAFGVVLATLWPAMAGAQDATPSGGDKVVFTVGSTTDLVSPNPFKAISGADYETLFLAYDMLYNFGVSNLEPDSGLAYYPPEQSADGLTWTFKVRSGVKWSDGTPFTARDIAFTYNFIEDNNIPVFKPYLGDPKSFEAPDDTTFVWTMNTPTTSPLTPPWVPIIPEHIWSKYDGKTLKEIKEVESIPSIGTGPFTLDTWKPGQFWSMTANKNYWGGVPNIDEVVFRVYNNPEALKLALENGEIDAAEGLPPNVFQSLQNQPNISTNVSAPNYYDGLSFNFVGTADPSLQNLDVRKAIAYSINKQAIVDRVALGYAEKGESIVLPTYSRWAWQPDESQAIGYDPGAAKTLLDQAGYKDTNGDGFRETPSGKPWSLEILTMPDVSNIYSVQEGKLISGWMEDVGIKTTIKTVTESKAYDIWYAQDFDMYVWGFGPDPDPDFIVSIFTKGQCGSWSDGCWSDPAYEKLYQEQHSTADVEKRVEIVDQMQQMLYDQVPVVVLQYEQDLQAYRNDRFTGFVTQPQPVGSIFFAFGPESYIKIKPVTAASDTGGGGSSPGGIPVGVWVGLIAVIAVILIAVVLVRRKGSAEDVE